MNKLAIFAAMALLFLPSCKVFNKGADTVSDQIELVAPGVFFATTTVFNAAVSDSDKVAKAEILAKISKGIGLLPDLKPTKEQITELILSYTNGQTHWIALADAVGNYYEKYTAKVDPADYEKISTILHEISRGLQMASDQYLK